jgi:proline iminopeptidase
MHGVHGSGDFVETPAGRVYVELEGDGEPLILVPGGPGVGHGHYHPWFSPLAGSSTVVYFDQIGTGRSDRLADPTGYTVPLYVDTVETLRRHLGAEQVSIVGVSFGGVAAAGYAVAHPDRVRRLVFSNAQVDAQGWQESNIDNVNHELRERYPQLWEELLRPSGSGVASTADEYQQLFQRLVPELEWFDPANHPRLAGRDDPAEAFAPEVYHAFVGDDPEWAVTGFAARARPGAAVGWPHRSNAQYYRPARPGHHPSNRGQDRGDAAAGQRRVGRFRTRRPPPVGRGAGGLLRHLGAVPRLSLAFEAGSGSPPVGVRCVR